MSESVELLYLTADEVGIQTGGGQVTHHEFDAMMRLGKGVGLYHRPDLQPRLQDTINDPWCWDDYALAKLSRSQYKYKLAHVYAGTFTNTIKYLKSQGCKVTYTAAAHDIEVSRLEHQKLGWEFNYPHLTDPEQWKRYVEGYLLADNLIVPSSVSLQTMRKYGYNGVISVIPHGVDLPKEAIPLPYPFTVGYLGAIGPDKGLVYLMEAWKKLNYQDGSRLVIGGKFSQHQFVTTLINYFGVPHTTKQLGWLDSVSDFYNQVSLYVQPSATEGFGIEVVEALAHGRPALCSLGAGASDCVPETYTFPACDVDEMAKKIDAIKDLCAIQKGTLWPRAWRNMAEKYTWDVVKQKYVSLWRSML